MPRESPPAEPAGELPALHEYRLTAGQPLWRMSGTRYAEETSYFNPTPAPDDDPDERGPSLAAPEKTYQETAGRFDSTSADTYGVCYAALDDLTAIAETLLRDVSFTGPTRPLPYKVAHGRELVAVTARRDLRLVDLTSSAGLAMARQDAWLVQAEQRDYWMTRRWARWIRQGAKQADGLIWPSRRNPGGLAVALFDDRCGDAVIRRPLAGFAVGGQGGLDWLNRRLAALRTYVVAPDDVDPHGRGRGEPVPAMGPSR